MKMSCMKKILFVFQEHLFLKMSKYMLDKTSLMYLRREIVSSKCVQVPKGFLVVYMGCGEGELKLDVSKIHVITVCGSIDSILANTSE